MVKCRSLVVFAAAIAVTLLLWTISPYNSYYSRNEATKLRPIPDGTNTKFQWANVPQHFSVTSMKLLPTATPKIIPRIQHNFKKETASEKAIRLARLSTVKGNFTHAWKGYKEQAWLRDEVKPLSGGSQDPFGGWAATLIDSLGSQRSDGFDNAFR